MIKTFEKAINLPREWNDIVKNNPYLSMEFLAFFEGVTDIPMKYHCIYEGDRLDSVFLTFKKKKHNIGMFSKKDLFMPVTFIYIPLSISQPGLSLGTEKKQFDKFYKKIKGCKLILNVDKDFRIDGFSQGFTCPQCILDLKWQTFDEYLDKMRSDYRYRYKKALKKSQDLIFRRLDDNNQFTDLMYSKYLEVFEKSKFQIERLNKEFFQDDRFVIFSLDDINGDSLGFIQLLHNKTELIFEFVGFDHLKNKRYDIYIRLLLEIVKYGIENKFRTIDFGQTADEAKLKLGCHYNYLYAIIGHSNLLINMMIRRKVRKLEYSFIHQKYNIFKE